jgi:hypothetical protein
LGMGEPTKRKAACHVSGTCFAPLLAAKGLILASTPRRGMEVA